MGGRFVATAPLPEAGILDWQSVLFSSFKENIDLLIGARAEADLASRAIVRGDIRTQQLGTQNMARINTSHNLTPVSFATSAPLNAFQDLRTDVQVLANDLADTRRTLNALISNMTTGA